MAADLILGPVVDATVSRVIVAASGQINLIWGWKADLKRFRLIMKMLGDVLQDADEKHVTGHPRLQAWLEELRAVADEADDMLEDVAYHNLRRRVAFPKSFWKKVSYLFTPSNHHPLVFRLRMANKVRNLNIHLADICEWATRLGLQYKFANTSVPMPIVNQQTHSFLSSIDPSLQVIGRDEDVHQIVSMLTDDDSSNGEALSVISIWGMPGLGKTTLAKAVYATDKIQNYFGKNKMWVFVSVNFDVQKILGEMLESLTKAPTTIENRDTLLQKIKEELEKEEKSYFLILDDVWNENSRKWDELRNCLLSISKKPRNRVVVTTRSKKVALTMGTLSKHMYPLKQLEDNECWRIIKGKAFGKCTIPLGLEGIGERIGAKCGGSPLVAAVIGGTLCNKRDTNEWLSIERKMDALSSLEDQDSSILHTLQLSFDQLPKLALKQCFAFCSIFPRAFVMKRDVLVQLWMAEGYLQPSKGNSMEDMGTKYFNDLLSYSLFQEEERDDFGNVESCKLHDLIYDLAESVSRFDMVIFIRGSGTNVSGAGSNVPIYDEVQHLNLTHGVPTNLGDVAPKLCTLFSSNGFPCRMGTTKFKRLRVLNFCDASDAKQLPTCFDNSKSLRYLDISRTEMEELPKFVTKLYNLQTFRFMDCTSLKMPPRGIGDLINLRHIYFNDEERMPANLGRLTNLQTLPLFFVGTTKGRKIEELGSLRGLKGRLEICKLDLVKGKSEAEKAKLHEKAVDVLELCWSEGGSRENLDEDVLEGLTPHSNIRILSTEGYGGRNLASWMSKSSEELFLLNNLVDLKIRSCRMLYRISGISWFSSLQRLSVEWCDELTSLGDGEEAVLTSMSLKKLSIYGCDKLERFLVNGFSSLEELNIEHCKAIKSIGGSLSSSTCLKQLYLQSCPKLESIPSLEGLVSLKIITIQYCDGFKRLPSGLSSCAALEELEMWSCFNLVSIPEELKQLRSLVKLIFWNCPKLRRFPEEILDGLVSLKRLELGPFLEELEEFPNLSSIHASLEELILYGWKKLTHLPQIQHLTALKDLRIYDFSGMESLPDWFNNLSSLHRVEIWSCPDKLKEKCTKGSGPDWHKISHVPYIRIDGEFIQFQSKY
ncbi:hypothetical protein SLEP1_g18620 [Rubroshorea leprosula]|uniref:Disease resistance protein RGA3 n=1 Tax=Rubroshorea leprosula TaxID=152421 RepID=A0AAV5J3Z2_9ROSI|nr:hypothetical protein SLEP1_g18620 [Rubroshorea leprosula]